MSDLGPRTSEELDLLEKEETFRALSDAYAFVHAEENLRSTASVTFGELLRIRVAEIQGPHPLGLPSRLEELEAVKEQFNAAIERLQAREEEQGV